MPVSVQCLGCKAKFRALDRFAGRSLKCPKCGEAIAVPGGVSAAPGGAKAALDEDAIARMMSADPTLKRASRGRVAELAAARADDMSQGPVGPKPRGRLDGFLAWRRANVEREAKTSVGRKIGREAAETLIWTVFWTALFGPGILVSLFGLLLAAAIGGFWLLGGASLLRPAAPPTERTPMSVATPPKVMIESNAEVADRLAAPDPPVAQSPAAESPRDVRSGAYTRTDGERIEGHLFTPAPAASSSSGDVSVKGHWRNGHWVNGYTRSRPSKH